MGQAFGSPRWVSSRPRSGGNRDAGAGVGAPSRQPARPGDHPFTRAASRADGGDWHRLLRALPERALFYPHIDPTELRQVACRALNIINAESYGPYRDRMTPAAVIPMNTPDEAIAELEYAVQELGLKVAMIGHVARPDRRGAPYPPGAVPERIPARFVRHRQRLRLRPVLGEVRGVAGAARGPQHGLRHGLSPLADQLHVQPYRELCGSRRHAVSFAVPRRRHPAVPEPQVPVPRVRCRAGRACCPRSWCTAGRSETSTPFAPRSRRPGRARPEFLGCSGSTGSRRAGRRWRAARRHRVRSSGATTALDDFAGCQIESVEDIHDLFVPRFFFGCEADDPLTAWAFNTGHQPGRREAAGYARLRHGPLGRARHPGDRPRGARAGGARAARVRRTSAASRSSTPASSSPA